MHVSVYWIPLDAPGRLGLMPRPPAHEHLGEGLRALRAQGVDSVVSLLRPDDAALLGLEGEEAECVALGMRYASFPIEDFGLPGSEEGFWETVARIDSDLRACRTVVVHCLTGVGRSGMVTSGVLMFRGIEPQEALDRVSQARGRPVPETHEQRSWLLEAARRR